MAILEITMLFLGSIIGAGFATGAELMTFFGKFHLPICFIALIVGGTMFFMITFEILLFYPQKQQTQSPNHHKKYKIFLDVVIVMIYLILFTAMTAGIAKITNPIICLISLVISTTVVLFGINHLSRFNLYVMIIIITLIITTALPHLPTKSTTAKSIWIYTPQLTLWALLYAGLNCFMFPELIHASAQKHKRHTLLFAGLFTAFLVTVLIALIIATIYDTNTQDASIPLLAAAPNYITTIIILLAILTSQYTTLFATFQRIQKIIPKTQSKPLLTTTCICLFALLGSLLGFNRIIQFGYPIIGAITCFYLLFSFLTKLWRLFQHHY